MSDENGDSDRDASSGQTDDDQRRCEYCGAVIDTSEWYPVSQVEDSDGTLNFYSFCDEECQDSWHDDQTD